MLISKKNPWQSLVCSLNKFSKDFMNDRNQPSYFSQKVKTLRQKVNGKITDKMINAYKSDGRE